MKAAVREIGLANELGGRVKAMQGSDREPELTLEKIAFGCLVKPLKYAEAREFKEPQAV